VGTPPRIRHIPLSWPVEKARSNHQPKFRPVGDNLMRGRERTFNALLLEMFSAFPLRPALQLAAGEIDAAVYLDRVLTAVEPYRNKLARVLQRQFNESALNMQDRIRGDVNRQLRRLRSPARLTDARGAVTKQAEFGTLTLERGEWSPIGVEAFNDVSAESVRYATEQSGTLVTNMAAQQQVLVRDVIGSSFTTSQTFSTGRTVTGLTRQQTSQALMEMLHAVEPGTAVGQSLAASRLVNVNGLTARYENAVARFAERTANDLARQGKSAVEARSLVRKKTQKYANKLRRSRARMIARTEIKTAQVQGQLAAMRQAVSDGLADPATALKTWVTGATDVCSMCSSLAGKSLLLDRSFEGVGDGPPAHPNCRCDLDFSTSIARAPVAVDGGNPAMPLGSEQNPIVYRFPSGFQSKPSSTRAFMPQWRTVGGGSVGTEEAAAAAQERLAQIYQSGGDTDVERAEALFDHLGFANQPRVVEADDLAAFVDESPTGKLFRVVSDAEVETPIGREYWTSEEVAEAFRTGDLYIGDGAKGIGTYTVEGTAAEFEAYASRALPNTYARGDVLEMTLTSDARIYEMTDWVRDSLKLEAEYAHLGYGTDAHSILASLGYDAVRYPSTRSTTTVVLNRGKVIVARTNGITQTAVSQVTAGTPLQPVMPRGLVEAIGRNTQGGLDEAATFMESIYSQGLVEGDDIARVRELVEEWTAIPMKERKALAAQGVTATEREVVAIANNYKQVLGAEINDAVQAGLDAGEVMINVDSRTLTEIASSREKRIVSQFESHSSAGIFDPAMRAEAEYTMFGYMPDEALGRVTAIDDALRASEFGDEVSDIVRVIGVEERPIYGYVGDPDLIDNGAAFADQYGDTTILLRSDVKARATVTFDDSLDLAASVASDIDDVYVQGAARGRRSRGVFQPSALDDVDITSSADLREIAGVHSRLTEPRVPGRSMIDTLDEIVDGGGLHQYIEAQVHGGVGLDDIAEVIIRASDVAVDGYGYRLTEELIDGVDRLLKSEQARSGLKSTLDMQRVGEVVRDGINGMVPDLKTLLSETRSADELIASLVDDALAKVRVGLDTKIPGITGDAVEAVVDELARPALEAAIRETTDFVAVVRPEVIGGGFRPGGFLMEGGGEWLPGTMRLRAEVPDIKITPSLRSFSETTLRKIKKNDATIDYFEAIITDLAADGRGLSLNQLQTLDNVAA
jgi:hypothetical protein